MVKQAREIEKLFDTQRKRQVFSCFRREMRFLVAPLYLAFSVVDYIYSPEHLLFWGALRLSFVFLVFFAFSLLQVKFIRTHFSGLISSCVPLVACWIVDFMIYQSGGYKSNYLTGLILITMTGIQILKMNRKNAVICSALAYFPAVVIVLATSYDENFRLGLVQAFFLLYMLILSYVFTKSTDSFDLGLATHRYIRDQELSRLRRTELLNRNFPPKLRELIESGAETLPERRMHGTAVIGFADITASTAIANQVGLIKDWEIKEKFLEAAHRRATSCNLIVLTHTGDGFMFLGNYYENADWTLNLISFFEGLVSDFEKIRVNCIGDLPGIETGIKCGVAMGPSMIGFIGTDQSYFTAMGPDVNLASRLCSKAENYELVVSSRVWHVLKHTLFGWTVSSRSHADIKGFDLQIPAVHISPRRNSDSVSRCAVCGDPLSVVRTLEGFIDVRCNTTHPATVFVLPRVG